MQHRSAPVLNYCLDMPIRPVDLPADRARLLVFLRERDWGLSEGKYGFITEADRPGTGLVAEEEGAIVGYVGLAPTQQPGEWAMELVSALAPPPGLLEAALEQAAKEGARRLRWWVYDPRQERLPVDRGFIPERNLLLMRRPLPFPDKPRWNGFAVGAFRPGVDEEQWLEVNNAAFADHPENGNQTLDDLQRRMSLDWFDPEGLRMAWDGARLAGFCWTKVHADEEGEIYIICTAPDFQGRGLGRALVQEGMRHLSERGCNRVFLYTEGDNEVAVSLYRSIGFDIERIHRSYLGDLFE